MLLKYQGSAMNRKYKTVNAVIDFWIGLIKPEMQKELDLIESERMRNRKQVEFSENLKTFRINLAEHVLLCMPVRRYDLLQLNCVGTPMGYLRAIMKQSNIKPEYLDGKIIDMEITSSDVVVYNRKENKTIKLYDSKKQERVK